MHLPSSHPLESLPNVMHLSSDAYSAEGRFAAQKKVVIFSPVVLQLQSLELAPLLPPDQYHCHCRPTICIVCKINLKYLNLKPTMRLQPLQKSVILFIRGESDESFVASFTI